jgi:hypothetical protein
MLLQSGGSSTCSYTVVIKTSCNSPSYTGDRISLSFGDAYGYQVPFQHIHYECFIYVFISAKMKLIKLIINKLLHDSFQNKNCYISKNVFILLLETLHYSLSPRSSRKS